MRYCTPRMMRLRLRVNLKNRTMCASLGKSMAYRGLLCTGNHSTKHAARCSVVATACMEISSSRSFAVEDGTAHQGHDDCEERPPGSQDSDRTQESPLSYGNPSQDEHCGSVDRLGFGPETQRARGIVQGRQPEDNGADSRTHHQDLGAS